MTEQHDDTTSLCFQILLSEFGSVARVEKFLDALDTGGIDQLPPTDVMINKVRMAKRNVQMRQEFVGHNYDELARKFGISSRQVRRVVDARR